MDLHVGDRDDWMAIAPSSPAYSMLLFELFAAYPDALNPGRAARIRLSVKPLACYGKTVLVAIDSDDDEIPGPVFVLSNPGFHQYVSGSEQDIYSANLRDPPLLTGSPEGVAEYLRLFLELSRGDGGWHLVEAPEQLVWRPSDTERGRGKVIRLVKPIKLGAADPFGRRACQATLQRAGALVRRSLVLWPDGLVVMGEEKPLIASPLLGEPRPLAPFWSLRGTAFAAIGAPLAGRARLDLSGVIDLSASDTAEGAEDESFPDADEVRPRSYDQISLSIARTLLDAAIKRAAGRKAGPKTHDPVGHFFAHLKEFRPIVAIESAYQELQTDFAALVAEGCDLPANLDWHASSDTGLGRPRASLGSGEVVLLTEASFQVSGETGTVNTTAALSRIIRGPHVGLIITDRVQRLPQEARERIDRRLAIPRMDEALFRACCRELFPASRLPAKGMASWVRYVLPRDLARAAAATDEMKNFLREIEGTVRDRLERLTVPDAPALDELEGLGEARFRMQELAADIRSAVLGEIGWEQVDRGYLLVGPPGTGKTTLVRSLAKECGVRFVLASASAWQEGTSLGPHLQNIRASFREARLFAPSILFIDEIDAIGNRSRQAQGSSYYENAVVDTVLEELQGFEDREGVVVIGATNHPNNVDEALRRPGRLDRIIEVPFPNVAALTKIYEFYLRRATKAGFEAPGIDTGRLGRLTFGRTGGHVEVYVRGAMRRARRDGRKTMTEADLVAEITNKPPDGLGLSLSPEAMRRVAVHEAGHALVAITGITQDQEIAMISITPRADGALGFVARGPDEFAYTTRDRMEEHVRIMLGGRAAEEVVFGADQISGGAGGNTRSDLARASQAVLWMLTVFGFSEAGGLLWIDWQPDDTARHVTADAVRNLPMGDEILKEARRTLDRLYAQTIERLISHRHVLDNMVAALIDRQDLTPEDLRRVVAAPLPNSAKPISRTRTPPHADP